MKEVVVNDGAIFLTKKSYYVVFTVKKYSGKIPSNVKVIDWHYVLCHMPDGTTSVEIPEHATVPDDFMRRENLTELVFLRGRVLAAEYSRILQD
ncbi:MAG: hypothetical protein CMF46_04850 [Legionellales bacterium]|nr:hypothetical protein [Legionellales bacterium]